MIGGISISRWIFLIVATLFATTELASAQSSVFRTRRSASSVVLPLVLGGGIEYESDSDHTQYDFPLVLQYSFTETFQASIETAYTHIRGKSQGVSSASGLDDLETSVEYEFLRERRYFPSLTVLGGARWPTSTNADLGAEGIDGIFGVIATKEINKFEFDFNAIYTQSGDPGIQSLLELPLALEYSVNHSISLAAEIAPAFGVGGGGDSGTQTELTLGVIWRASPFWTLESGLVLRDDNTWQLVFGCEYSFAGD